MSVEFLPPATRGRALSTRRDLSISTPAIVRTLQRLHIGANDITYPADFGVAVDFVGIGPLLAKTILEGFDCDIESDFVPELKTVGDSFRS